MSYFQRASARSKGSCTVNLSPCEKQLLLQYINGKGATKCLLACILHTAALNTDPDSCPPEAKPCPMKTIYTKLSSQLYYLWFNSLKVLFEWQLRKITYSMQTKFILCPYWYCSHWQFQVCIYWSVAEVFSYIWHCTYMYRPCMHYLLTNCGALHQSARNSGYLKNSK